MKCGKRIVLFSLFAMNLVDQPAPEVTIDQGILSGKISSDGSFFEYLGIPYATLNSSTRFKAPGPAPTWKGVFKAIDLIAKCAQYTDVIGVIGTEDCLKINVYVPAIARKPIAVMVHIHGGAFCLGDGGKIVYVPDFLLKQDVIVVTFNYRLGILGFLCLGIEGAPGNAGMKDQVAALKWVKKNIASFGGDPDNITIFGESAGGTSVSLMLHTQATKNLFHRAIIMSGSSLASWAVNRYPLRTAAKIAKILGVDSEDPEVLFSVFSKMSYKALTSTTANIPTAQLFSSNLLHLPCIEKNISGVEPFLNDIPYNLLIKHPRNISVIYGITSKEGLLFVTQETDDTLKNKNREFLFADDVELQSVEEENKLNKKVKEYYFGSETISRKTLSNLSQLYSHLYFTIPVILESELMSKNTNSNIYNYYFKYSGGRNLVKKLFGWTNVTGAYHGDDLGYVFKTMLLPFAPKGDDVIIIEWMTGMFATFAKYGNPTPPGGKIPVKWTPQSKSQLNFLYVDKELKIGPLPEPQPYQFWKDIYDKYRRTTLPSY